MRKLKLTKIYKDDGTNFECIRVETILKEAKRLKKFAKNKVAQQKVIDELKTQVRGVAKATQRETNGRYLYTR